MLDIYLNFEVEDFVFDETFVCWALDECTGQEREWNDWMSRHPLQAAKMLQARNVVRSIRFDDTEQIPEAEIQRFIEREQMIEAGRVSNPRSMLGRLFLLAACFILIAGVATFYFRAKTNDGDSVVFANTTDQSAYLRLPDGSSVILKPGSEISFPKRFAQNSRKVSLAGAAFFDVVKKPDAPFRVLSSEMETEVKGTSFFVEAYDGSADFKVTVSTGHVKVAQKPGFFDMETAAAVNLHANQQAKLDREGGRFTARTLKTALPLSEKGMAGNFEFKNATVADILTRLGEVYDIPILFDATTMGECRLTVSLQNDSFYDKLDIICRTIDATLTTDGGRIGITGGGCGP